MHKILLFGFCCLTFLSLTAQEINTTFGKNRVQYSDDFDSWSRYETENFITYWYGKSRSVAISAIQLAEFDFNDIQNIMEHRMNDKIEIVVYGDIAELYQTNIGLRSNQPEDLTGVDLIGNKLLIYFDGNHNNLRINLRRGVAKVFLYSMLYGNSFTEMVQNKVMADIPEWFKSGLIDYVAEKWNQEHDAELRQLLLRKNKKVRNFKKLTKMEPELAGHAFWNYLGENYGHSAISNILYLSRINRSIPSAFRYVLGEEYSDITEACLAHYKAYYEEDNKVLLTVEKKDFISKTIPDRTYQHLNNSPDNKWLVYSTNHNGRLNLYVKNLETGKRKKIKALSYNNPFRTRDDNYPIYFWSADSRTLGLIFEESNILQIWLIDNQTNKKVKNTMNPIFNRIYSADFINEEELLLSANTDGFSNLFSYHLNRRIETPITNDFYDDLDAQYAKINGVEGFLFSSNRKSNTNTAASLDTSLTIGQFDLYFMEKANQKKLIRLSNTIYSDEFKAHYKDGKIDYLTNKFGMTSLLRQEINSDFVLVNKGTESIQYSYMIQDKACLDSSCYISAKDYKYSFLTESSFQDQKPLYTSFQKQSLEAKTNSSLVIAEEDLNNIDDLQGVPSGWYFQSEFGDPILEENNEEDENNNDAAKTKKEKVIEFNAGQVTSARLRFKVIELSSSLDNKPLFTGLNSYSGDRQTYQNTPLGLLFKARIDDLFEDYLFEGGVRLATNFSGYETYLTFEDRKEKWDHFYGAYFKQASDRQVEQLSRNRRNTTLGYYQIRYPFNEFMSVRGSATLRNDKEFTLAAEENSYKEPQSNEQRIGLKLEFVYDNSSRRSLNILNGSRSKIFVEGLNRFAVQVSDPFFIKPSEGFMTIVGFDSRYYLPVLEKSVLAFRIAGASTFGSERVLFLLGGVEGSLFQPYDNSTPIPQDVNFVYQNLAPQMRGFDVNIRNGSSYALGNIELRVPIFRHLFSDQIRYDFIREFQVVGFFDVGTAWFGISPYSPRNPINTTTVENPSVILNVRYFRDPLVAGYGWGVRSSLFGYFVKIDHAWGLETKNILQPKWHLSIGTDF